MVAEELFGFFFQDSNVLSMYNCWWQEGNRERERAVVAKQIEKWEDSQGGK